VERAEAAPAIAAVHRRIAPAETLTNLRQPRTVCRLVVVVGIDRALALLSRDAAGVQHLAMRRLEVDALNEIEIDSTAPAKIRRPAEESDLGPACLHRELQLDRLRQLGGPGPGGQHQGTAIVPALVGLDADDLVAFHDQRLHLNSEPNVGSID